MVDNLKVWCQKVKVSVCDFLLFSLKSQIENEAPSLKKQVDKLVNMYSGKDDIGEDRKRSALEGLALKVDCNLSSRQYQSLINKEVMKNYPNQHDVEIAQCEIDPGNVSYSILEEDD